MFSPQNRSISTCNVRYTGRSPERNWGPAMNSRFSIYSPSNISSLDEATSKYLKRPVEARPAESLQFHRPSRPRSPSGERWRSISCGPRRVKSGMSMLVEQLHLTSPRSRSPSSLNQEAVELSHYPNGRKLRANEKLRIERDDFPAPPCPFVDHAEKCNKLHRLRHSSSRSASKMSNITAIGDVNGMSSSVATSGIELDYDSTGEVGESDYSSDIDEVVDVDDKLKKERHELSKIHSSMGEIFLKEMDERDKLNVWQKRHLDPRKSSRTPSARGGDRRRLRYDNPINASPSRHIDRVKPWEEDSQLDLVPAFASHSSGTDAPVYPMPVEYRQVISSLRHLSKPGNGIRALTLPVSPVASSPVTASSHDRYRIYSPSTDQLDSRYTSPVDRSTAISSSTARLAGGGASTMTSTGTSTRGHGAPHPLISKNYSQEQNSRYSQYTSSDARSEKSDYFLRTADYTGGGKYSRSTSVERPVRVSSSIGRVVAIDYADRGHSSADRRSITPGTLSSDAGYNTSNYSNEPPVYVSSVEYHVDDYNARNTRTYGAPTREYQTPYNNRQTPIAVTERSRGAEVNNLTIKQRQYNLMSSTSSTAVDGNRRSLLTSTIAPHLRRSMPNVNMHSHGTDCATVHPYRALVTSNYHLPPNVDRCHLEVNLFHET